jgi:hypothetical protein
MIKINYQSLVCFVEFGIRSLSTLEYRFSRRKAASFPPAFLLIGKGRFKGEDYTRGLL